MSQPLRKPPQIQAPELMTAPERTRDTLVTALMWGVYLYLWAPLISLFAWLLGFEFAYDVMVRTGGAQGLSRVLSGYALAVMSIFVVITAWSWGNRLRYGKLSRRRSVSEITLESMAEYFEVDVAVAARLRSLKFAAIAFDADGRPGVTGHVPASPDPESPQRRGSEPAKTASSARHNQA